MKKQPKFKIGDVVIFCNYKGSPNFGHIFIIKGVQRKKLGYFYNIGKNKTNIEHTNWLEDCFRLATKLDEVLS